jgi:RNA polymerase sigma-70 factor (ECF subfamily)
VSADCKVHRSHGIFIKELVSGIVCAVVDREPGLPSDGPAPEILDQLRRRLVSFGASRLQRDVAEDLAQDTLLLLTTKYQEVTGLDDLLPLSIKVMRFKILSHHRKAHRRGEDRSVAVEDVDVRDPSVGPHTLAEQRQAVEQLKAALRQLGERCRKLFRLKLEGRGFAEIGALLGAGSVNTVYSWEFRCREQLRRLLRGTWGPGGAP